MDPWADAVTLFRHLAMDLESTQGQARYQLPQFSDPTNTVLQVLIPATVTGWQASARGLGYLCYNFRVDEFKHT